VLIRITVLSKNLCKFGDDELVLLDDLFSCTWNCVIVIMACGVAGPYHKVDIVLEILLDPFECLVNEGDRAVAARGLGSV